jgi:hypothetical protein
MPGSPRRKWPDCGFGPACPFRDSVSIISYMDYVNLYIVIDLIVYRVIVSPVVNESKRRVRNQVQFEALLSSERIGAPMPARSGESVSRGGERRLSPDCPSPCFLCQGNIGHLPRILPVYGVQKCTGLDILPRFAPSIDRPVPARAIWTPQPHSKA